MNYKWDPFLDSPLGTKQVKGPGALLYQNFSGSGGLCLVQPDGERTARDSRKI